MIIILFSDGLTDRPVVIGLEIGLRLETLKEFGDKPSSIVIEEHLTERI